MASDSEVNRVLTAANEYDPRVFTDPANHLPKNQTGLTYYQKTLSPGAQLKPFGVPAGDYMTAIRSSKKLMGSEPIFDIEKATQQGGIKGTLAGMIGKDTNLGKFMQKGLNLPSYGLYTKDQQEGLSGRQHYNMFSKGPVPAYIHQMKAKFPNTAVPTEFGAPEGTKYTDWMGRKLEDFVATKTGQRINPYEFTTKFMPHEDQVKLMEEFHASLPEDVQKWRIATEDPGPGYATQSSNYLPKAKSVATARNRLKDIGYTAGGAGVGGLGGHYLYRALTDDDDESWLGNTLSTGAGMGLGGAAGYLATPHGRSLLTSMMEKLQSTKTAGYPALSKLAERPVVRPGNFGEDLSMLKNWATGKYNKWQPGFAATGTRNWTTQHPGYRGNGLQVIKHAPVRTEYGPTPSVALNNLRYGQPASNSSDSSGTDWIGGTSPKQVTTPGTSKVVVEPTHLADGELNHNDDASWFGPRGKTTYPANTPETPLKTPIVLPAAAPQ